MMIGWLRHVIDLAVPRVCETCDTALPPGHRLCLCGSCISRIQPTSSPTCHRCGAVTSSAAAPCGPCRHRPPAFASARALGLYRPDASGLNPLPLAVQRLKYDGRRVIAATLGGLLARRYPFAAALVVPVPLHPRRLRARGFNQALLLARHMARARGLPLAPRALTRVIDTASQADLDALSRQRNVRAAFEVHRPALVRGQAVVLVDDVLTTGATADACARALRVAGATRVDVYTVARAS